MVKTEQTNTIHVGKSKQPRPNPANRTTIAIGKQFEVSMTNLTKSDKIRVSCYLRTIKSSAPVQI